MSKKVIDLKKARNKKKQSSIDEIAEASARRIFDNIPDDLKEPEALASGGDMSKILEEDSDEEKDK